jgi:Asp-tRNA(Asn)/Glu-tRNA(Gln) amidotransferase A subunit family amidase
VLTAFGKKALQAQEKTNCLTEILISDAESWASKLSKTDSKSQPLKGLPISLKDSVTLAGYDSTIGYSRWAGKPCPDDSPLVKLLKDAGAVPFVKTAIPITLMCKASCLYEDLTYCFHRQLSSLQMTSGAGAPILTTQHTPQVALAAENQL